MNNPLKYTDPTGYQTASAPGAVSWFGGGGGWGESGGWGNVGPHWSHYMPNVFSDPVWGYRYDWDTKTYYAEHYYGNDEVVPFKEVDRNYIQPNRVRDPGNVGDNISKAMMDIMGVEVGYTRNLNLKTIQKLNNNFTEFVKGLDDSFYYVGEVISFLDLINNAESKNLTGVIGDVEDMLMLAVMTTPEGFALGALYFVGKDVYSYYQNYNPPKINYDPIPLNPADNTLFYHIAPPLTPRIKPYPYSPNLIQGPVRIIERPYYP